MEVKKSLFDYTDEEWPEVQMILMRGAGRRYKNPAEVLATVISLKRLREIAQEWFTKKKVLSDSYKKELIEEILTKNKRENLTPREQKEVEMEGSRIEHALSGQETYRFKLHKGDKEFAKLYYLGYNQSDFILDELEEVNKAKGEEKEYHDRMAEEMYQYCKRKRIKIPEPIEDYFLKRRGAPTTEEVRDWYLENKPNYSINKFSHSDASKPKWELGIWGYVILGILFLLAVYSLKGEIIPVAIGVILSIGLWILWFGILRRSLWQFIVLILFLIYLLSKASPYFK